MTLNYFNFRYHYCQRDISILFGRSYIRMGESMYIYLSMWMCRYVVLGRGTQTDMFCVLPHVCYFAVCILNKGKLHEINFELYQLTSNETCKLYLFVWTVFRHCLWNHCCKLNTPSLHPSVVLPPPAHAYILYVALCCIILLLLIVVLQFKCVK